MRRGNIRNIEEHDFYCVKCGNKGIPIMRRGGNFREAGHLKKLYCLFCKKEINHVECLPFSKYTYEDFKLEFENNNFDEEGNRKVKYSTFKSMIKGVDDYEK